MNTTCISCRVVTPLRRYTTALVAPLHPLCDATAGWMVAYPERHVTNLSNLEGYELDDLMEAVTETEKAMIAKWRCSRVYIAAVGTSPTDHLHFHIVPVWGEALPGLPHLSNYVPPRWLTANVVGELAETTTQNKEETNA